MATKMDMSLDEIITTTKTRRGGGGRGRGGRGNRQGGRGGRGLGTRTNIRRGGSTRGLGRRSIPGRAGNAEGVWTHDKFQDSGLGSRKPGGGGGGGGALRTVGPAKITISNLHYGVSDSDIMELFGELGNIRYASVHYDRSGRSMGKADVTFERKAEAQAAIQQYNGVPLDGRPMQITWANPTTSTTQQVSPRGSNLRQIQGKRINRNVGGGGGFRGGRGRGGSRGGGKQQGKQPTAEELDAELDAYVSQNQK